MSYRVGQRVRVASRSHDGHHRTPDYIKGKTGRVERVHASFTNPETRAYGADGLPEQPLYLVGFAHERRLARRSRPHGSTGSRRRLRALAGGTASEPITTTITRTSPSAADEPPLRRACACARGAARREGRDRARATSVEESTGSPPARLPTAPGSSRVPGSIPTFKERLLADARAAALEAGLDPGPVAGRRRAREHRRRPPRRRLHALLLLSESAPRPAAGLVQEPSVPIARRLGSARRARRVRARARRRRRGTCRRLDGGYPLPRDPRRRPGTEAMSEEELATLVTRDSMIGVAQPAAPTPRAQADCFTPRDSDSRDLHEGVCLRRDRDSR